MRNHATLFIAFFVLVISAVVSLPAAAQNQEQVLYSFQEDENGAYPISSLTIDPAGNLYGTANLAGANGAGTVFQLVPAAGNTWNFVLIHTFDGQAEGADPRTGLLLDSSGKLYGTTSSSGSSIFGTIFELTPNGGGWDFAVIHDFTGGTDGGAPSGDLIADAQGNLYGATSAGGGSSNCIFGCGTIFQLKPSPDGTWTERILYRFQGGTDGAAPVGRLVRDSSGNIYGITAAGGSPNCGTGCGTAFKLSRNANGRWQKKTLRAFADKQHGWSSYGGLVLDQAGNLYGSTSLGGDLTCNPPNGCGVLFKLTPAGQEVILHRFSKNAGDGMFPTTGLVPGASGHFYGATSSGGQSNVCGNGCGIVFELTTAGKMRTLYNFNGDDGAMPQAPLFWDGAGHIFGTTTEGGTGFAGTAFELTP